jgi:hypothetical protein
VIVNGFSISSGARGSAGTSHGVPGSVSGFARHRRPTSAIPIGYTRNAPSVPMCSRTKPLWSSRDCAANSSLTFARWRLATSRYTAVSSAATNPATAHTTGPATTAATHRAHPSVSAKAASYAPYPSATCAAACGRPKRALALYPRRSGDANPTAPAIITVRIVTQARTFRVSSAATNPACTPPRSAQKPGLRNGSRKTPSASRRETSCGGQVRSPRSYVTGRGSSPGSVSRDGTSSDGGRWWVAAVYAPPCPLVSSTWPLSGSVYRE